MKKIAPVILFLMIAIGVSACSTDDSSPTPEVPEQTGGNENSNGGDNPGTDKLSIVVKIGETTFKATLADNEAAKAFKGLLPCTFNMSELNGNEKYCSLPQNIPVAATNPGTIKDGDIMLYGSNTLVLFYKTFSTSYSYTRVGAVEAPLGLGDALGNGNVTVTFEVINE